MEPAGQLQMGDPPAEPKPRGEWFQTDDNLAKFLLDVEAVLRGALAKVAAVRGHLQHRLGEPSAEPGTPERMRAALEYMADKDSWLGNPHDQTAVLFGHDTPYELARETLGMAA